MIIAPLNRGKLGLCKLCLKLAGSGTLSLLVGCWVMPLPCPLGGELMCRASGAHRTSSGNDGVCMSPCGGFQCRKLACFLCCLDFLSVGFVLEDVLFCVDTMGEV